MSLNRFNVLYCLISLLAFCSCNRNTSDNSTSPVVKTNKIDTLGLYEFLNNNVLKENGSLRFDVDKANNKFAVLHGYIDRKTPKRVEKFISKHPNVTTLVFMQMSGSKDDESNLVAAQMLKNQNFNHYLPAVTAYDQEAFIASGAVDMFFAGNTRIVDKGAEVGVHSWSDGKNSATDFPRDNEVHSPYINYYKKVGLSQGEAEDFYFFTINAAPHDSIHFMSDAEITKYKLRTSVKE